MAEDLLWPLRANWIAEAGNADSASHILEELSASVSPRRRGIWNGAGVLKLGRRDFRGAEACFRRALQEPPDLPEALSNLGIALLQQGRNPRRLGVSAQGDRARPRDSVAPRVKIWPRCFRAGSSTMVRFQAWETCCGFSPTMRRPTLAQGYLLMREGRLDEARRFYRRARELGLDTPDIALHEAELLFLEGDVAAARSYSSLCAARSTTRNWTGCWA